jgi:hypothetical protein
MAILGCKVNVDGPLKAFQELRREQLPFTIARSLTLTAQDAQTAVRGEEQSIFKLRNDWTVRNTRIKPATKTRLVAEVFTDTSNRKTGAPDYLPGQEPGGEKLVHNGRRVIAIPTRYLLRMTNGVIPAELRPKAMLQYAKLGGKREARGRNGSTRLRGMSTAIRGMVFWVSPENSMPATIYGRYITDREPYPMYLLRSHISMPGRFNMEATVQKAVEATFAQNFKKAAIETMANDLLSGSGVSVKL